MLNRIGEYASRISRYVREKPIMTSAFIVGGGVTWLPWYLTTPTEMDTAGGIVILSVSSLLLFASACALGYSIGSGRGEHDSQAGRDLRAIEDYRRRLH